MSHACIRSRLLAAATLVASLFATAATAVAAPIVNFTTGLSLDLAETGTGGMTMKFTNAGDATQSINYYSVGIMLLQTSGSGSLTFDSWTKPSDPVIGDPEAEYTPFDAPGLFTLNAPVNIAGTDYFDYYFVATAATDAFNYPLAAGVTKDAGLMTFSVSGQGTWDVYAVNQEAQPGGLPVSLIQDNTSDEFGFGNLPAANGASLMIGTITAVPEPSTIALGGVALLVGLVPALRRQLRGRLRAAT